MQRLSIWVVLALLAFAFAGCAVEKSENPLSPTVAGPIPGVGISAPSAVEPAQGSKIAVNSQPISLVVQNATTNGVRPLSYLFEVASDSDFSSKVFSRDGITPGDGQTSIRLPDALASGRNYYWRARAGDGANTGPYSNPTLFAIYTPVVIDKPIPISPVNNETTSSVQPTFTVGNAPRSGPAGQVSYELQVAGNAAFISGLSWAFPETPDRSALTAPVSLSANTQYYWRTRAYDPSVVGPWSDIQAFRTPTPVAPPPSGGGGTTTCSSRQPADIVACHRALYPGLLSPAQAPNLLRDIAIDLNRDRPGYYGRFAKTSGNSCSGFACDIICGTDSHVWDVFSDGPDAGSNYSGSAAPQWIDKGFNSSYACVVP